MTLTTGLDTDVPKLLANKVAKAQRVAQLAMPHMWALTALVQSIREERRAGGRVPHFDPWDGGIDAEVLYLLEAPGPQAVRSGFVSRNNPDETAKNFHLANSKVEISRRATVLWNVVPWSPPPMDSDPAPTRAEVTKALPYLRRLLDLLPRLRAVVLMGKSAQKAEDFITRHYLQLQIFKCSHPSPQFVNRQAGNRTRLEDELRMVAVFINEHHNVHRLQPPAAHSPRELMITPPDPALRHPRARQAPSSVNPWNSLRTNPPYVLEQDRDTVERFNLATKAPAHIELSLMPEPFVGNVDAPVLLLTLNPGVSAGDFALHQDAGFRERVRRCHRQEATEYPNYYVDPAVTGPGARWLHRIARPLVSDFGARTVANSLTLVEFFPYHSERFAHATVRVPSQAYTFALVQAAIARDAAIFVTRGRRLWNEAIPELCTYPRLFLTRSVQNIVISEKNCPDGYAVVAAAMEAQRNGRVHGAMV